jgi:hypothetical protein
MIRSASSLGVLSRGEWCAAFSDGPPRLIERLGQHSDLLGVERAVWRALFQNPEHGLQPHNSPGRFEDSGGIGIHQSQLHSYRRIGDALTHTKPDIGRELAIR